MTSPRTQPTNSYKLPETEERETLDTHSGIEKKRNQAKTAIQEAKQENLEKLKSKTKLEHQVGKADEGRSIHHDLDVQEMTRTNGQLEKNDEDFYKKATEIGMIYNQQTRSLLVGEKAKSPVFAENIHQMIERHKTNGAFELTGLNNLLKDFENLQADIVKKENSYPRLAKLTEFYAKVANLDYKEKQATRNEDGTGQEVYYSIFAQQDQNDPNSCRIVSKRITAEYQVQKNENNQPLMNQNGTPIIKRVITNVEELQSIEITPESDDNLMGELINKFNSNALFPEELTDMIKDENIRRYLDIPNIHQEAKNIDEDMRKLQTTFNNNPLSNEIPEIITAIIKNLKNINDKLKEAPDTEQAQNAIDAIQAAAAKIEELIKPSSDTKSMLGDLEKIDSIGEQIFEIDIALRNLYTNDGQKETTEKSAKQFANNPQTNILKRAFTIWMDRGRTRNKKSKSPHSQPETRIRPGQIFLDLIAKAQREIIVQKHDMINLAALDDIGTTQSTSRQALEDEIIRKIEDIVSKFLPGLKESIMENINRSKASRKQPPIRNPEETTDVLLQTTLATESKVKKKLKEIKEQRNKDHDSEFTNKIAEEYREIDTEILAIQRPRLKHAILQGKETTIENLLIENPSQISNTDLENLKTRLQKINEQRDEIYANPAKLNPIETKQKLEQCQKQYDKIIDELNKVSVAGLYEPNNSGANRDEPNPLLLDQEAGTLQPPAKLNEAAEPAQPLETDVAHISQPNGELEGPKPKKSDGRKGKKKAKVLENAPSAIQTTEIKPSSPASKASPTSPKITVPAFPNQTNNDAGSSSSALSLSTATSGPPQPTQDTTQPGPTHVNPLKPKYADEQTNGTVSTNPLEDGLDPRSRDRLLQEALWRSEQNKIGQPTQVWDPEQPNSSISDTIPIPGNTQFIPQPQTAALSQSAKTDVLPQTTSDELLGVKRSNSMPTKSGSTLNSQPNLSPRDNRSEPGDFQSQKKSGGFSGWLNRLSGPPKPKRTE